MGPDETVLAAGDTLLLQGTWKALDEHLDDPDVLVVNSPELVRRQAVPMGAGAMQAIAVLLVMVLLLATGVVPLGRRRAGRRRRHGPLAGTHGRAGLPRRQLDDRDPGRRDDAAFDRHGDQRGRATDGQTLVHLVGDAGPLRPARRTVRVDRPCLAS